jgi:diguanylate cyclase (GGDEF)-like protein
LKKFSLRFLKILLQCTKCISLKDRIYYSLMIIGLIGSLLGLINTYYIGETGLGLLAAGACFLYLLLIGSYSLISHNIDRSIMAICLGINFFIFPLNYFGSGGIKGGMPLYFLIGIYSINLLPKVFPRFCLSCLSLSLYSGLILYGYFHPETITPMPSDMAIHIDIVIALILVSFMICSSINTSLFAFNYEQKKALRLTHRLNSFAIKDPLTLLYNRRYLNEQLSIHTRLAHEHAFPLCVIMFDVDHFKQINDSHGHLAGDAVLQSLSKILLLETRRQDIVGRYGGEEFLVLLFDTSLAEAKSTAERIRCTIAASRFTAVDLQVTISGGIAAYDNNMQPHDLIAIADENLYKAKLNGRNKIVSQDRSEYVLDVQTAQ